MISTDMQRKHHCEDSSRKKTAHWIWEDCTAFIWHFLSHQQLLHAYNSASVPHLIFCLKWCFTLPLPGLYSTNMHICHSDKYVFKCLEINFKTIAMLFRIPYSSDTLPWPLLIKDDDLTLSRLLHAWKKSPPIIWYDIKLPGLTTIWL